MVAAALVAASPEGAGHVTVQVAGAGALTATATKSLGDVAELTSASGAVWRISSENITPRGPRDDALEEYALRGPRTPDTIEAQWQLAEWCRLQHLLSERESHLRRILELDSNHADARAALGYQWTGDAWLLREERFAQQGLVRYKGQYVSQEEIERLRARDEFEQKEVFVRRQLRTQIDLLFGRKAARAVQVIRSFNEPAAVRPLAEAFYDTKNFNARLLLLDVLAGISGQAADAALAEVALFENDNDLRAAGVDHLSSRKSRPVEKQLTAGLAHEDDAVVNRAGEALGKLGVEAAVPALIDALVVDRKRTIVDTGPEFNTSFSPGGGGTFGAGRAPTRIVIESMQHQEVLDALVELTNQNFGFDVGAWQAWLARQRPDLGDVDLRRDDR